MERDNKDSDARTAIAIFLDPSSFAIIVLKALLVPIRYHQYHRLLQTSIGEHFIERHQ